MNSTDPLSQSDLRAALRAVANIGDVENRSMFYAVALSELQRLIGADAVAYSQIDPRAGTALVVVDPPEMMTRGTDEALARFGHQNPLVAHARREPHTQALKVSDFLTQRDFRRREVYQYVFRPSGLNHQMACGLPSVPPRVFGFSLNRCSRDFDERDRALLDLMRPHLLQAYDRAAARERSRRPPPPSALRTARLSVREIEVVELLAEGASDEAIAEQLFLSPRTVHSHVSSALRKTGCANRTELAVLVVRRGSPSA